MRIRPQLFVVVAGLLLAAAASAADGTGPGDRLKLACPAGAGSDHPCRAVYFWGADGKRHAFPNEKVYFSWYRDFTGIKTVDAAAMAGLTLGRNATYRPGSRLVKIPSVPEVYAVDAGAELRAIVSESAAAAVFGADWNSQIDDLSEVFFLDYRIGADIAGVANYDSAARLAAATDIDADSGATYRHQPVTTAVGTFDAYVIALDRRNFQMKTAVASATDCADDCAAKPLADYAADYGAGLGLHGTYFCPPDYPDCTAKTYSFLWPVFDSASGQMRNAENIKFHEAPIVTGYADGHVAYYPRANAFGSLAEFTAAYGSPTDAAIANYPGLMQDGTVIVASEPRLEEAQRTVRGTRGGLGFNREKFFLVIAKNATVPELAEVMKSLGADNALNLDGGGSAALLYGGVYKVGPGRLLPNAIVFVRR